MKHVNCIVVFDATKEQVLFCKRIKDPYKNLYNFPGGKVEAGEDSISAAYRELQEETGIGTEDITLFHLMDFTYYVHNFVLEIYVGQLHADVDLVEEKNPLLWLPLTENFADSSKYAGEQNIAHIINMALKHPLKYKPVSPEISPSVYTIGIDGCKGGWIVAAIENGRLNIIKKDSLKTITDTISFDSCIIDMVIGLQSNQNHRRPEEWARKELKSRASTMFPAPCRQAIYGETKAERLAANEEVLGKKFTSQTDAIIPKIREVDEFLQKNSSYKNRIMESHPELCFARLNGSVVLTSKHTIEGVNDRIEVLSHFFPEVNYDWMYAKANMMKCNMDDIFDSICLAIVANLNAQGRTETVPTNPMMDETGLLMQMVVPRKK